MPGRVDGPGASGAFTVASRHGLYYGFDALSLHWRIPAFVPHLRLPCRNTITSSPIS
jgi:hypothetical protein